MSDTDLQSAGDRLRSRRRALQLTLSNVANQADITEGYLSSVERGRANASIPVLQRICTALRLQVGDLFAQPQSAGSPAFRFRDARGITFGNDATKYKVTPSHFDHLEILLGHFEPGGSTGDGTYTHGDSEEVLLVIEGSVEVTVDGATHVLDALDSIHYRSSQPHRVSESTSEASARVVWTMSPPTY